MSRVSNNPIIIPTEVKVLLSNHDIRVEGPLGFLEYSIDPDISLDLIDGFLKVRANSNLQSVNALSGTVRVILANMIQGVSKGFEKKLQLVGVGYRAQIVSNKLNLALGFSHPIDFEIPHGIKIETPSQTEIIIKGTDKQKVGQIAADIRAYRKPEPYKGKGVRYIDEVILLKETKKK